MSSFISRVARLAALGMIALSLGTVSPLSASETSPAGRRTVEIIGHRGASHDAPENTLAAVKLSWKQNADGTEIDVHLSKDGKIVVIHDDNTKRTAGLDKPVVAQSIEELRKLDAGSWKDPKFAGEKLPTLDEVIATIPDGKRLFIEVKCGPEIVPELKRVIEAGGKKPEQTAIISFSQEVVAESKKAMPALRVFWITRFQQDKKTKVWSPSSIEELIEKTKSAKVDGIDLGFTPNLDRAMIDQVKQAKLEFYVWTVDSADDARLLRDWGVDGITTNRPLFIRQSLNSPAQ
ncbi:MAG: glycerophosphodiester phosphodiesterase [Planctomycetaceae bacterium]